MNSNTDNGITVSASGQAGSNYSAFKAVDGRTAGAYNAHSWAAPNPASDDAEDVWYKVSLGSETTVYKYDLTALPNITLGREPKDWGQ
jgi:hypothetical protein